MTTGQIVNNLDLSEIFQSGTSSIITGYKISNGQDIGELFQTWDRTVKSQASRTGYKYNDKDLNIDWKYPINELLISEKDKVQPSFLKADMFQKILS